MLPYLALLLSAVLVGVDQLLKLWALRSLRPIGTYPIIQNILHLTYVENRGAAFGMMEGQKWLLIWVTALVLLLLIFVILGGKVRGNFPMFTLAVILGGGVGNLIDRIYRGFVVDYIHLKVINFAVFNFADICVTLGTAALICWLLFGRSREEADGKKSD
ncbi:MAG: signal peptidase II [Oscillospiraceae bacterium]|nr:signal peptidase II [Oscillospiraceae bacterium]